MLPTVALPPVTPFTCQVTAVLVEKVTVEANCTVPLRPIAAVVGEIEIGSATVTAAEAPWVVSATETAVTVTEAGLSGAVYRPLVVIVPVFELPPTVPFTCQVTAVLEAFFTVARR